MTSSDASTALAVRQKVQQFLTAARTGNLELFKKLSTQLDEGLGLAKTVAGVKDANKRGALHFAAREGKIEICKYLLEELKLFVDCKDDDGANTVMEFLGSYHVLYKSSNEWHIREETLCLGFVVYDVNSGSVFIVQAPKSRCQKQISDWHGLISLLAVYLSFGMPKLSHKIIESVTGKKILPSLLREEFDGSSLPLPYCFSCQSGETPLLHASRQGQFMTVKYLIECGANPASSSDLGATALHHAAGIGNIELLSFLLSKGADVDSQSDAGTPLIWAAGHGQQDAVKVLLEHHADPNVETDDNITPLLSSVAAGSLHCLELLVQAGANANVTAGGATPLHIAADNGSTEIISCLLNVGANPNVSDEDSLKPIQIAALRGHHGVVAILFPLTSPIKAIVDWSVDGIIAHMQSEAARERAKTECVKRTDVPKDTDSRKHIVEVTPEAKEISLESKSRGDDAFKRKDYLMAVDAYTQAIDLNPNDATLLSNRSLCWIRLGQADQALADAKACRELKPDWPKSCYREGAALRLLQKFDEAANAFYEGVKLDPENKELVNAFREAVEAGRKFHGTVDNNCKD